MNSIITYCLIINGVFVVLLAINGDQLGEKLKSTNQSLVALAAQDQRFGVMNPDGYIREIPRFYFDDRFLLGVDGLSPSKDTVRFVEGNIFRLHDLNTGKMLQTYEGHIEQINDLKISVDRKYAVSSSGRIWLPPPLGGPSKDATARLWDLATGKEIMKFEGHKSRLNRVYLSPDNQRLLTNGSEDRLIILWDVKMGKQIKSFSDSGKGMLSPDGKIVLITQSPNNMVLWDSQTGAKKLAGFEQANLFLEDAAFDPMSSLILTWELKKQPTLQTWDVKTGKQLQVFKGHTSYISDARFTPDGQIMISGSSDKTVRFWDIKSGKELKQLKSKGALERIFVSGDGKRLYATWRGVDSVGIAMGNSHGTLWDIETSKEILNLETDEFVGFSPDGSRFLMTQSLRDLVNGRPATWFDSITGKAIKR